MWRAATRRPGLSKIKFQGLALTAPTSVGAVGFLGAARLRRCRWPCQHDWRFFRGVAMPNITMLDIEELRKTKLKPYIDKCLEHRAPDPGFHAVMGHNIDLCEAMFVAWDACFNKGRIPHTLKEVIRVQLSRAASCSY
jgi:hypothetical protein